MGSNFQVDAGGPDLNSVAHYSAVLEQTKKKNKKKQGSCYDNL